MLSMEPRAPTFARRAVDAAKAKLTIVRITDSGGMAVFHHHSCIISSVAVLASQPVGSLLAPDVMVSHASHPCMVLGSNTSNQLVRADYSATRLASQRWYPFVQLTPTQRHSDSRIHGAFGDTRQGKGHVLRWLISLCVGRKAAQC